MAHTNPRPPVRRSLHLAVAAVGLTAAGVGCAPTKSVTFRSTPDGATVLLFKASAGGKEAAAPLDERPRTPGSVTLDFTDGAHYRAEAHKVLCAPNLDTQVRLQPESQTAYDIPLTQFKDAVAGLTYVPRQDGGLWQMVPDQPQTVATIDTAEPPSSAATVDQPVPVTDDKSDKQEKFDYPSFAVAAGPAGTVMVYEQVRGNSQIKGGQDSRLWKLPLTPGVAPTLLTTNRKQQHDPAFSYTGDEVIFDTTDDSRTRRPVQFRTASDESTVEFLAHDADTCETQFTAGRDALAFTAFSPNAASPQVMVCARDGSGPTARGTGFAPQISPDGNRIAFVHRPESGGHLRLATVNVHGPITTGELQLDADHDAVDPHWSPDGKLIAYCSDKRDADPVDLGREPNVQFREPDDAHSFLWLVTADGRTAVQLTHGENYDSHPVFDPNGRTIYFRSNRGGQWNIWKLNLTDAVMTKLAVGR